MRCRRTWWRRRSDDGRKIATKGAAEDSADEKRRGRHVRQDQPRGHREREIRAHHQVLRGRVRDVPVEDLAEVGAHGRRRLCRAQHQSAQGRAPRRARPFRHPGGGRRDRVRPHAHQISGRRMGAAALDAAVRRHHRQRSRRQRVRHLAEGHEEPPRRLCAEHRRAAAALHHARGDAHHAAGRDGALLCRRVPVRRAERQARRSQPLSHATARSR